MDIGLSKSYFTSLDLLDAVVQKRANAALIKFDQEPQSPGLNLEKLNNDFWSIRVDRAYRIILHRNHPDFAYVFVWVDHHDAAYDWANARSVEVKDDIVYLINIEELNSIQFPTGTLYEHVTDYSLRDLHIPDTLFPIIRSMNNENDLYNLKGSFHPLIFESLIYLTDPSISLQEIIAMQEESRKSVSDTSKQEGTAPQAKHTHNVVQLNDALHLKVLEQQLNSPIRDWKLFLHPSQSRLVEGEFKGPVKVLGGAGTGKTVVVIHRAKYLASRCPEDKILLTTFTKNLAEDIEAQVKSICTSEEFSNIEVRNIDSLIYKLFREIWPQCELLFDKNRIDRIWEAAISQSDYTIDFPLSFYKEEWNRVIISQNVQSAQDYASSNRRGRGVRLTRKDKYKLWDSFACYRDLLIENNLSDIPLACQSIINYLDSEKSPSKYSSILVDEVQDFDEIKLRLLRTLAGEEHDNDMFLVGDSQQQIYHKEIVLKNCGINVPGQRSLRLRINYRTTEEIRRWAYSLFDNKLVDDLDDGMYEENRYISLLKGPEPTVENYKNQDEEIEGIINYISDLEQAGEVADPYDNICLIFRRRRQLQEYKKQLENFGFRCYEIKSDSTRDFSIDGICMTTLHRAKGLEFDHVFICSVNDGVIPYDYLIEQATDLVMKKEAEDSERNLLYVAATRARKTLHVLSHGKPSRFLNMNS